MKQLESRIKLLFANIKYSFRETVAYAGKNWGNLISTSIYTLTYIAFLSFLFANVDVLAGYTYGEMLFMFVIGQITFYLTYSFAEKSGEILIDMVKSGDLDLVLSKPVPTQWFIFTRGLEVNVLIVDALPALLPVVIIALSNVDYTIGFSGLVLGIATQTIGLVTVHATIFIASMSVFALGEAKRIRLVARELQDIGGSIPFEGFPSAVRRIGLTLLPVLIATGLSTSYYLGKTTSIIPLVVAGATAIVLMVIKQVLWVRSIKKYSSASS